MNFLMIMPLLFNLNNIEIPKNSNPFGISDFKIKEYISENWEDNYPKEFNNLYFVDSDDDYKLLNLTGGFPIDIRYRESNITEKEVRTLKEYFGEENKDVLFSILGNSKIINKIED